MQPRNRAETASRRGDIQGLRALAVMAVVGYHAAPSLVPGGFVGVDIFFVISGFLITLLLVREIETSGRISLSRFYSRRIRRLLPAAVTVTIATVAFAALVLGPLQLARTFEDAAWASAYLANLHLSQTTAGYFAATDPSLFTHFWSLAVEEQYYLLWPLILTGIVLFARRRWRLIAPIVLGVVLIGSLVASVVLTSAGSNDAYYSLGTRAWELAIGGAVAFAVHLAKRPPSPLLTAAASLLGLAAITWSLVRFSAATPFPGWTAAVPTIGAALLIWAGSHSLGDVSRVLGVWPLRFIGNISYSLYLWHWPVLVFGAGFAAPGQKVLLVILSVALAIATYYLVERPAQRWRPDIRPRRIVAGGLAITLVVVVVLTAAASSVATTGGPAVAEAKAPRLSAQIVGNDIGFTEPFVLAPPRWLPQNVEPALGSLSDDLAEIFLDNCMGPDLIVCEGGDPSGSTTIVLAGDSQAGQWWPAVDAAATEKGWRLYLVGKNGCPLADFDILPYQTEADSPRCSAWQRDAPATIAGLDPDLILYANLTPGYRGGSDIPTETATRWSNGVATVLHALGQSPVVYFGQFPILDEDPDACLYANIRAIDRCDTALDDAVTPATRELGERNARDNGALFFDPASLMCDESCHPVNGNHIAYRDKEHLTGSYSALLAPALGEVIAVALRR